VLKIGLSFRLRVCRGGSIQRAVRRMAGGGGGRRRPGALADPRTGDASSASASCSGVGSRFPYDQSLSLSFLSLRLRSRFCHLSVPAQFLCNWGSSFEDFLLLLSLRSKTLARIRDVILCILSFIGQGSISCTPPDELSLLRVPCSRGPR
jgi:hypothetical protein